MDVTPQRFERVRVRDGGMTLDVFFYTGVDECHGLDRVDVELASRAVTLTVMTGRVETAEACIALAEYRRATVRLDEPVGDRRIIDGAAEVLGRGLHSANHSTGSPW